MLFVRFLPMLFVRFLPMLFLRFIPMLFVRFLPMLFVRFLPMLFLRFLPMLFVRFLPMLFLRFLPMLFLRFLPLLFVRFLPLLFVRFLPLLFFRFCPNLPVGVFLLCFLSLTALLGLLLYSRYFFHHASLKKTLFLCGSVILSHRFCCLFSFCPLAFHFIFPPILIIRLRYFLFVFFFCLWF